MAGKRGTLRPGAPARMHWPREAAGRPGERPLGSRACLSLVPVQAVAAGADLADIERARNVAVGTRRYDGSRVESLWCMCCGDRGICPPGRASANPRYRGAFTPSAWLTSYRLTGDNHLDRCEIEDGYGGKSCRVGAGQQAGRDWPRLPA